MSDNFLFEDYNRGTAQVGTALQAQHTHRASFSENWAFSMKRLVELHF